MQSAQQRLNTHFGVTHVFDTVRANAGKDCRVRLNCVLRKEARLINALKLSADHYFLGVYANSQGVVNTTWFERHVPMNRPEILR